MIKNHLKELPWNVKDLKLQELDVRGNHGLGVAAKLFVGKELRELEGWLSEFESGSAIQDSIKVMLVGEGTFPFPPLQLITSKIAGMAGKTSIVKCLEFIASSCLVKNSLSHLQNRIVAQAQQAGLIGRRIPSSFQKFQDSLRAIQQPLIPWQQFQAILEQVCS